MSPARGLKRRPPGAIGANYEQSAESYLHRHGLKTLERNYRCRRGEIDLVMRDSSTIVFVEVRYRASSAYGDPIETITGAKQRRIITAAKDFLARRPRYQHAPCRFDAVGVTGSEESIKYDWITDAFST